MLRNLIMTATIAAGLTAVQAQEPAKKISILPEPVSVTSHEGEFLLTRASVVALSGEELLATASYFSGYMEEYLGYPLEIRVPHPKKKETVTGEIRLVNLDNGETPGGYQLHVTPEGIAVRGNDASGVFYGIQTLIQLLPTRAGVLPLLPAVAIEDYPRFPYRGMHLDVVRHYFPVSYIKRYIDYLALHKLNYFHWHLTDDQGWRVEMKCRPELTAQGANREGEIEGLYPGVYTPLPYGGYYTQEEVKEIVKYAADRYITVVPEIDIPGHCMALLAVYPEFSTTPDEPRKAALTWGIYNKFNNVLAPKPEVFAFLTEVFSELCDLFPGPYIHVGGDECAKKWWKESEQTQAFMKENGLKDEKALQSYFIHYVQKVLNDKGKILIGWDEIMEGGVSTDCVVMNWRRPEYGMKAAQAGHPVIMASSGYSYFNLKEARRQQEVAHRGYIPVEKVYTYPIVPEELTAEEAQRVIGAQACMWTEYFPTPAKVEFGVFPRLAALSENTWSVPEVKSWERFVEKMPTQLDRYDLWGIRYSEYFLRTMDIAR
ncbi:MAG: beta-N-acetylhexosaminidase [Bacteroides sp.]|nr:beta-N-acetylhexosaminidase [Bacteroides sp.]